MLVSNQVDDVDLVPGVKGDETGPGAEGPLKHGYNWKASDRTHRVALRGTVKAEYVFQAGLPGKTDTKPVPLRHFVNAHVNILNGVVNGVQDTKGVVTIAQANDDFVRANEQYAQVGILLIPNFAPNVAWPAGVNLANGLSAYPNPQDSNIQNGKIVATAEEAALLGANPTTRSTGLDDIEVYYVTSISGGSRGVAYPAGSAPAGYEDSLIISADDRPTSPFTPAHEIGHVLLDDLYHFQGVPGVPWQVNLMRGGTSEVDGIVESKRLTNDQYVIINSKRMILLK